MNLNLSEVLWNLKVRQSWNDFFQPAFFPKNQQRNSMLILWNLRSTCFCSFFWKKLKTPNRYFEINWPLVGKEILKNNRKKEMSKNSCTARPAHSLLKVSKSQKQILYLNQKCNENISPFSYFSPLQPWAQHGGNLNRGKLGATWSFGLDGGWTCSSLCVLKCLTLL